MFDKIKLKEAINDLWDSGLQNDNLVVLYELNKKNRATIRTPIGDSEKIELKENVLQGGSWGPLKASNQMDTIGKESLREGEHVYMYQGVVPICVLEMVDDTLGISECGTDSIETNAYLNTKVEMKNPKFGLNKNGKASKCHHIHVGKPNPFCPDLKAHNVTIDKVDVDSYVGDLISNDGKLTKTVEARYSKATGITSQIINMLKEVSLGHHFFNIGMIFRNLKFINAVLINAEVWHSVREDDLKYLKKADKILLRKILATPSTTCVQLLYLETGAIPIEDILKCRRLNFLHYILNCKQNEMLPSVFRAQLRNPSKGDWTELVRKDLVDCDIFLTLKEIKVISAENFKKKVINACKNYVFKKLINDMRSKDIKKGSNIQYSKLEIQSYLLTDKLTTQEIKFLFKLRTNMLDFRVNFKNKYDKTEESNEQLQCPLCNSHIDNEENLLVCSELVNNSTVKYSDVFSNDMNILTKATKQFQKLWKMRQRNLN